MSSTPSSFSGGYLATAWGIVGVFTATYVAFHLATHSAASLETATSQLLRGETHWITFQNRLLGCALIELIRLLTGSTWLQAFYILVGSCSFVAGAILVHRAWQWHGDVASALGAVAAWFLLAVFFNHVWSYPWDFVGALLNLLLLIWVSDHYRSPGDLWSWRPLVLLFAQILNRESSLITLVSLALMVGMHDLRKSSRGAALRAVSALAAGAVGNIALVIALRRLLFVASTRPASSAHVNETVAGNFLQLRDNFSIFVAERLPIRMAVASIIAGFGLLCVASLVRCWQDWRMTGTVEPGPTFALCYLGVSTAALAFFACASEFRVYYELIPVCIVLALSLRPPVVSGMPA
ncbi:MAG: hypothetical protein PHQ04_07120 [Opitutaceae bacterium]|nr:hypothetical protein [Opitutaceae bacterium]